MILEYSCLISCLVDIIALPNVFCSLRPWNYGFGPQLWVLEVKHTEISQTVHIRAPWKSRPDGVARLPRLFRQPFGPCLVLDALFRRKTWSSTLVTYLSLLRPWIEQQKFNIVYHQRDTIAMWVNALTLSSLSDRYLSDTFDELRKDSWMFLWIREINEWWLNVNTRVHGSKVDES